MADRLNWGDLSRQKSKQFTCGHCSAYVASSSGFRAALAVDSKTVGGYIYVCPHCDKPTYFDGPNQFPGPLPGNAVAHITDESVEALFTEARRAVAAGAYTAAVLACRTVLAHVAVGKGAKEDQGFKFYVDYLISNHYAPPGSDEWVDHIRNEGNDATHKIQLSKREDAEELVTFLEWLLKYIYEMPGAVKQKAAKRAGT